MAIELIANYTSASVDPREFARMAEGNGFDGVGCSDHLFRTAAYPHLWVAASAMAQVTERVFVTSSFANNLFRTPAEFAQASLTMQWLSGGRFEAGLGAGWLEQEVVGAGLPYPAPAARARRYREAMLIVARAVRHRPVHVPGRALHGRPAGDRSGVQRAAPARRLGRRAVDDRQRRARSPTGSS